MVKLNKITKHECRKVPVRVAHTSGGKYVVVGDLAKVLELPAQSLRRYASHAPVKGKSGELPSQLKVDGVQVAVHASRVVAMVAAITVRGEKEKASLERGKKTVIAMLQRVVGASPPKAPAKAPAKAPSRPAKRAA